MDPAAAATFRLILIGGAAFMGAVIASYLGVVAERGWKGSADGRSACVCGRTLRWWENIPILSWALLRGRCACRKVALPVRYVATEAALAAFTGTAAAVGGPVVAGVALVAGGWVVLGVSRRSAARRSSPGCSSAACDQECARASCAVARTVEER